MTAPEPLVERQANLRPHLVDRRKTRCAECERPVKSETDAEGGREVSETNARDRMVVGALWRRKKTGALLRISNVVDTTSEWNPATYFDVSWETVEKPRRRGTSYEDYWLRNCEPITTTPPRRRRRASERRGWGDCGGAGGAPRGRDLPRHMHLRDRDPRLPRQPLRAPPSRRPARIPRPGRPARRRTAAGRAEALREFARKWADWIAQDAPQVRGGAAYRAIIEAQAIEDAALADPDGGAR